ncbi:MAG TPA: glycogen debranching protein GlgX [Caulobacteraceae bacterium]|jgi:glycogen operon protein
MPFYPDRLESGSPAPLGASWDGIGVNFAVFSANAERIDLCVFDPAGRREIARFPLPEWTDEVWHGYLPNGAPGLIYGFRAYGPYAPEQGHRFNPNKLLLDPYARALRGEVRWTDALFGYRLASNRGDLSFDRRDSAPAAPKAIVVDDGFAWRDDRRPRVPWSETVIYEAHVKGLTQLFDEVRPPAKGALAGIGHPEVIAHLRRLGVTTLELMPIHAFLQDRALIEKGLSNYWGYNTLGFFSPEPRYLVEHRLNDLRKSVRQLHAAGIEVILDVVYNHTCEGSELGPTLSWRGLDNASYYRLVEGDPRRCVNDTGTGNTLDLSHPRVLQMVTDSLRYWATDFHVDGFRFDLCTSLGRESDGGFDAGAGFFDVLRQDPVLSELKLIAEPWDVGPGGYRVGAYPPGFSEWNDRFRDGVRRFWRGDPGMRADLAARLSGSGDLFDHRARRPWASVNYLASHDGFTLNDVVSYGEKHNEANGEDNRDGHSDNHVRNWGHEGPTDDPEIQAVRDRVRRSMLMTLFTAQGAPMLLAGDEVGRTQRGNNNAYCQDNEISWIDWRLRRTPEGEALLNFVAKLIATRRRHGLMRPPRYLYGQEELRAGVHDVDWFDERGERLSPEDWQNPEGRALVLRRAMLHDDGSVRMALLLVNASDAAIDFTLPTPIDQTKLLISSAEPEAPLREIAAPTLRVDAHGACLLSAMLETPRR